MRGMYGIMRPLPKDGEGESMNLKDVQIQIAMINACFVWTILKEGD